MKVVFRSLALIAALLVSGAAAADQYPSKTVKVIVPFAAGGPTDVVGRMVAQELSERLKQTFYVENVAGAGGNTGMALATRSPGDGYTLLFASSSIMVNPSLYQQVPYDFHKDFIPITKIGAAPNALIVHPALNIKSMKDLVTFLKANAGKYSFASPGIGTTPSLSVELFRQTFGLDFAVIQFKSGGLAVQSVLGQHTPMSFQAIPPATALIKEGKLVALAVTAAKRVSALPDVPTIDELGTKGQEAETMTAAFAPAGTPKAVVDLLQREIAAIVQQPEFKAKLTALGVRAGWNGRGCIQGLLRSRDRQVAEGHHAPPRFPGSERRRNTRSAARAPSTGDAAGCRPASAAVRLTITTINLHSARLSLRLAAPIRAQGRTAASRRAPTAKTRNLWEQTSWLSSSPFIVPL